MLAISGRPFSGDRLLAKQLAQDHGLRCLEAEVVVERAAARGASHAALWDALLRPPRLADRLLHRGRIPLILLQAALAEEIRAGAGICWGCIADLLPFHQRHPWVRIHVHAPMKARVSIAQEQLKLGRREAINLIEREDRERERWMRHVHGVNYGDTAAYDLVVNLEHMAFPEACEILSQLAQRIQVNPTDLSDLALAHNVKAALVLDGATSHLDLDAAADNGLVRLSGKVPGTMDLRAAEHAALQVPGVTDVSVEGIRVPSNEGLPAPVVTSTTTPVSAPIEGFRTLWPVGVAVSLLLCLAIVYPRSLRELPSAVANVVSGLAGQGTVYAGYITDTECGSRVELGMEPDCIRECVHRDSAVRYALYDGKNVYPLSGDQSDAERYAAKRVQVRGQLDAERGTLEVMSIEPVT